MRVFIAEKYEQAKAIAEGLCEEPVRIRKGTDKDGYFQCGPNDLVVWAQGHIYRLAEPHEYDRKYEDWKLEDLPIVPLPGKWKVVPIAKRQGQIRVINDLLKQADTIVHACDFDREGQLIGDEIMRQAPKMKTGAPVLRLNASDDLSKNGVRAALGRMRPNAEFADMGTAALARGMADLAFGVTLSRAYTIEARRAGYSERDTMATGRVQTPTLAMIVRRDLEIEAFEPIAYHVVAARMKHRAGEFVMAWKPREGSDGLDDDNRIIDRGIAERICSLAEGRTGRIVKCDEKTTTERPPLPHRMTSLVAQASAAHHLTATQVRLAAQALYERYKIISYPRSDCRYLPEGQHGDAPAVLHAIARNDPEKSIVCGNADIELRSDAWDTSKLGSHHAIIPVANTADLSRASDEERIVYDLVCRAYIAQFYPEAQHAHMKIEAMVTGEMFAVGQKETIVPGWRLLYPTKTEREKQRLPLVEADDEIECRELEIDDRMTKPKERFTDGTLMTAMEDAGRHLGEDEEEGPVSIGTEATRTDTIEGLFEHRFVERDGRHIKSTRLGRDLIRDVQDEIKGVRMTAAFERVLDKIAEGKSSPEPFLRRMEVLLKELLENVSIKDRRLAREGAEADADDYRGFIGLRPDRKTKKKNKKFAA